MQQTKNQFFFRAADENFLHKCHYTLHLLFVHCDQIDWKKSSHFVSQYETLKRTQFLKLLQSTNKGTSNLNVFLPSQFQTFPTVKVFLRFSL